VPARCRPRHDRHTWCARRLTKAAEPRRPARRDQTIELPRPICQGSMGAPCSRVPWPPRPAPPGRPVDGAHFIFFSQTVIRLSTHHSLTPPRAVRGERRATCGRHVPSPTPAAQPHRGKTTTNPRCTEYWQPLTPALEAESDASHFRSPLHSATNSILLRHCHPLLSCRTAWSIH
jgi:hypothetical protein